MFITTSFVSKALYSVSLLDPLRKLSTQEKITVGGCALKRLKKLKGAKFTTPSVSTELTKAIGLGETAPVRLAYSSLALIDFASNVFIEYKGTESTCFLKTCININFNRHISSNLLIIKFYSKTNTPIKASIISIFSIFIF